MAGIPNSITNSISGGRNVIGPVAGGLIVQGDYHNYGQPLPAPLPTPEELKKMLESAQQLLKKLYSARFLSIQPLSQEFTCDIKKTWVPLTLRANFQLKEDFEESQATEGHANLLIKAFEKEKMLIIEGDPATGKTCLMRRLAYEWAQGKQELLRYNLVVYAEFRKVYGESFERITDLVVGCSKTYFDKDYEIMAKLLKNEQCNEKILILLDGYDESSSKQCSELNNYLFGDMIEKPVLFDIVITTRKGFLSSLRGFKGRCIHADVLGFTTDKQKQEYISKHFQSTDDVNKNNNVSAVSCLLQENKQLNQIAENPLFLTFICLLYERIKDDAKERIDYANSTEVLLRLYCNIIWYLLDRYQKAYPHDNVPDHFGYQPPSDDDNWKDDDLHSIIKDNYFQFPQLHFLGLMALHKIEKSVFSKPDLKDFNVKEIVEKVGLIRKEESKNFLFPHRSIQEFLAAFAVCYSNENTLSNEREQFKVTESLFQKGLGFNEFRMFVRLFAETKTIRIEPIRQQHCLEWLKYQSFPKLKSALRELYLIRFKLFNPFSLPFPFNIENTWVSLTLIEDTEDAMATQDHAALLKRAYEKADMLIIEGQPATGKTSLMRRLAYDWAKGAEEMSCYDLVIYAEFREVHGQMFKNIVDLVLAYFKYYIQNEELNDIKNLLNDTVYCQKKRILLLIDGFDESSDIQCQELSDYFNGPISSHLPFNVLLSSRKGYLSKFRKQGRFTFVDIIGFATNSQKQDYISKHFTAVNDAESSGNIDAVIHLLNINENLRRLSETPLMLIFICLTHKKIIDGTEVELYMNIIWWMIERYQKSNPNLDVPRLFDFKHRDGDTLYVIKNNYQHFPQLHFLGTMAMQDIMKITFTETDLRKFKIMDIVEQVGFLRREVTRDTSLQTKTEYSFVHRTVQEFIMALTFFLTNKEPPKVFINHVFFIAANKGYGIVPANIQANLEMIYCSKIKVNASKKKLYSKTIKQYIKIYSNSSALQENSSISLIHSQPDILDIIEPLPSTRYQELQPTRTTVRRTEQDITLLSSENGTNTRHSQEEVIKLVRDEANQGNAKAQLTLGAMYEFAIQGPQSDKEAVKWYRKSAEQGDTIAQYSLGNMYREGKGVPQSDEEALQWYWISAEQGNADAQFTLGNMYREGKGLLQSDEEAVTWYRKSAEQGNAIAQFNLGNMYREGKGLLQSDEEAVTWYRKSAEQGNADAQNNLERMYQIGSDVPQSNVEAVKWYRKAIEQGKKMARRKPRKG